MELNTDINLPVATKQPNEKPVETLVINNNVSLKNNNKVGKINPPRVQDEKITTAVMKVLEGYDWTLVPAATK